jgi:hypothetical protein
VQDPAYSTWRMQPASPGRGEFVELVLRVQELNGGSPYYAPRQRELLLEAGFVRTEGGASAMSMGRRDQMEFAQPLMEEQFSAGRSSSMPPPDADMT